MPNINDQNISIMSTQRVIIEETYNYAVFQIMGEYIYIL